METLAAPPETDRSSTFGAIVRFMAIAITGPILAGLVVSTMADSVNPLITSFVVALAMPAPLIAALLLESGGGRGLLRRVRDELHHPLAVFVLPIVAIVAFLVAALAFTAVGLGVDDGLATTPDQIVASVAAQLPAGNEPPADELPSFPALVAVGLVAAVIAGFTLNGVFAFGEEYGWRQFVWDRLEPYGRFGTVGVLGVLWGVWHAPLILLVGLNYPNHRLGGVAVMVAFTVAASWPLDEIRRATDGAVGPAAFHGMVNGAAGLLVILAPGHELLTPPAGLIGALAMLAAGATVRIAAPRLAGKAADS